MKAEQLNTGDEPLNHTHARGSLLTAAHTVPPLSAERRGLDKFYLHLNTSDCSAYLQLHSGRSSPLTVAYGKGHQTATQKQGLQSKQQHRD